MKHFLKMMLFFLLILIGVNFMLGYFANKAYFGDYEKYSLDYSSYILSDSHGLPLSSFTQKYGIYNFSAGSDSYFDMQRKVNFLLQHKKIDTIYITVDDHMLSKYREMTNNLDRSRVYATREDFDSGFEFVKEKYLVGNIVLLQPKTSSVIKEYLQSLVRDALSTKQKAQAAHKKGQDWNEIPEPKRLKEAGVRFKSQFPSDEVSEKLKNTLVEIVNTCRKNHVALVGIKFPLAKEYIDIVGDKNYGADKLFKEMGLPVMDYKDLYYGKADYFKNQDHMNEKGGEKFVEKVFGNR